MVLFCSICLRRYDNISNLCKDPNRYGLTNLATRSNEKWELSTWIFIGRNVLKTWRFNAFYRYSWSWLDSWSRFSSKNKLKWNFLICKPEQNMSTLVRVKWISDHFLIPSTNRFIRVPSQFHNKSSLRPERSEPNLLATA